MGRISKYVASYKNSSLGTILYNLKGFFITILLTLFIYSFFMKREVSHHYVKGVVVDEFVGVKTGHGILVDLMIGGTPTQTSFYSGTRNYKIGDTITVKVVRSVNTIYGFNSTSFELGK